jgi:hypothetical protein
VHDFQNGRFNSIARMNGTQIGTAGAVRGAMPFNPTAQNMRFSDRQATSVPRMTTANTRFFTHQTPSPVQRTPIGRAVGSPSVPQGMAQNGVRGGDNTGFRRFGSPSGQSPQVNAPQRNGFGATGQSPAMRNDRPAQAPQMSQPAPRNDTRGGFSRFGTPGNSGSPSTIAPRQDYRQSPQYNAPHYNAPSGGSYNRQEPLRIAPSVVRERPSAPSYSAPHQSAPSYSAPHQSAPSYSAPRNSGGGGSHPSGGGGGGHASGGGGGHGGRR